MKYKISFNNLDFKIRTYILFLYNVGSDIISKTLVTTSSIYPFECIF